ncbi:hypothetical protein RND81_14G159100 [Saponaria officinalis]|uniref:TMEM205-like domain-containing protein n=1 Tax=Saponaria officinalis TaxID=3572 RepID=A0AAW1GNM6_SAPOF
MNLMGFGMGYGMWVWVTFTMSYVLGWVLGREQFGVVQSKVYLTYFRFNRLIWIFFIFLEFCWVFF